MAPTDYLTDSIELATCTTVRGVLFGINLALYFLCARLSYLQFYKSPVGERRKTVLSFIYTSAIICFAILDLGADTWCMHLVYIDHGGVNGEPGEFEGDLWSFRSAITVLISNAGPMASALIDWMQLWRTWVIWTTSRYRYLITAVPAVMLVVKYGAYIWWQVVPEPRVVYLTGNLCDALSFAFAVIITLAIVGRIIRVQRRNKSILGMTFENANHRTNTVAMLVESYALYASWVTAATITEILSTTSGRDSAVSLLFNNAGDEINVLAYLLVAYRVLEGRAWTPEKEKQLSTIRWNQDASRSDWTTDETTPPDGTLGA